MFPSLFLAGGAGQNVSVHKAPRSPLSGIPVRTAPAVAVSPMQVLEEPCMCGWWSVSPYYNNVFYKRK